MVRKQSLKKNEGTKKSRKTMRKLKGKWFQPFDDGGRIID
jgi:hypothetical protein